MRIDEANLKFDDRGLIPAIVQQHDTGEVLMMAWMNAESLRLTFETGTTWFWSRSRQELWNKGATSGNMQRLIATRIACWCAWIRRGRRATRARAAAFSISLKSSFSFAEC